MNKYKLISILLFSILVLGSCSIIEGPEDISNPMDPNDPDFVPPTVTFIQAPSEGGTVDTCFVSFEWEGNKPSMNYSYRIDDENWSDWSSDNTIEYSLLDEGNHSFEVKSRYFNGVESDDPQVISFTVDDLIGPALTLLPRYSVGQQNEVFEVEIVAHEVIDLALVKAILNYDPNRLTVSNVTVYESESLLAINGGTVIPFYTVDSIQGLITIEVGVATGSPHSVSGTGGIARIGFIPITTQSSTLSFKLSSELRNSDNATIQINDFGNGGVYVQ